MDPICPLLFQAVSAKMVSSWVREVLNIAKAYMFLYTLQGVVASAALVAGVTLCPILQASD